jgi:7-cyano-7-deazaguanine synthase in queuosine biosynthesis
MVKPISTATMSHRQVREHVVRLHAVVQAYYQAHREKDCGGCDTCRQAELALVSMGHVDEVPRGNISQSPHDST